MLDHGEQPLEPDPSGGAGPVVDGGAFPAFTVTIRSPDGRESEARVSEAVFRRVEAARRAGCVQMSFTNRRARRRARKLSRGRPRRSERDAS
jgi:hypothetical protein